MNTDNTSCYMYMTCISANRCTDYLHTFLVSHFPSSNCLQKAIKIQLNGYWYIHVKKILPFIPFLKHWTKKNGLMNKIHACQCIITSNRCSCRIPSSNKIIEFFLKFLPYIMAQYIPTFQKLRLMFFFLKVTLWSQKYKIFWLHIHVYTLRYK